MQHFCTLLLEKYQCDANLHCASSGPLSYVAEVLWKDTCHIHVIVSHDFMTSTGKKTMKAARGEISVYSCLALVVSKVLFDFSCYYLEELKNQNEKHCITKSSALSNIPDLLLGYVFLGIL